MLTSLEGICRTYTHLYSVLGMKPADLPSGAQKSTGYEEYFYIKTVKPAHGKYGLSSQSQSFMFSDEFS